MLIFYYGLLFLGTYFAFIAICKKYNLLVSFRMLPKKKINECKEGWKNFTTLKKLCFILAIFAIIVLLMDLFLGFIDRYHYFFIVFCFIVYLIARSIYLHPSDIIPPKEQIKELLSERWDRWESRSGLKKTYYVLASIVVSIFLYSFWFIFPEFLDKINDKDTSFYNLSLAVFAILSGFGAVFGFYTSIIKAETAEQGLITDRINKATEGLGKIDNIGNPVIEVRIGSLYALERIAQDSIRDHIQIMEILCAYIRHNSPLPNEMAAKNNPSKITEIKFRRIKNKYERIDDDIQTAITIIGRRDKWPEGKKRLEKEIEGRYYLNLNNCNLRLAQIRNANLSRAKLHSAQLNFSWLNNTKLNHAWLNNTDLDGAILDDAITWEACAYTGNFSKCHALTQEQINKMYFGLKVKISDELTRPEHWPTADLSYADFMKSYEEWFKSL